MKTIKSKPIKKPVKWESKSAKNLVNWIITGNPEGNFYFKKK